MTPAEDEFGLEYELFILQKMISTLPDPLATRLDQQLIKIIDSIKQRLGDLKNCIVGELQDLTIAVKLLEFDLEATRRERDEFKNRLDS